MPIMESMLKKMESLKGEMDTMSENLVVDQSVNSK